MILILAQVFTFIYRTLYSGCLLWEDKSGSTKLFFAVTVGISIFRTVITEEFKVPDKMVGFSKYPGCFCSKVSS